MASLHLTRLTYRLAKLTTTPPKREEKLTIAISYPSLIGEGGGGDEVESFNHMALRLYEFTAALNAIFTAAMRDAVTSAY